MRTKGYMRGEDAPREKMGDTEPAKIVTIVDEKRATKRAFLIARFDAAETGMESQGFRGENYLFSTMGTDVTAHYDPYKLARKADGNMKGELAFDFINWVNSGAIDWDEIENGAQYGEKEVWQLKDKNE